MAADDTGGRISHRHLDQIAVASADDDSVGSADGLASSVPADQAAQPIASATGDFSVAFAGVSYLDAAYGSYTANNSLPAVAALGGNAVAIGSTFGIDAQNSTVYADSVPGGYTESDADVGVAIGQAETLGLGVMLKPTIDFLASNNGSSAPNPLTGGYQAGEARTLYNPSNVASFFASYQKMIVQEATLAQADGATIFCVGTELDQLTGPAYLSYWTNIISAVRAVFTGDLTYAANWDDDISPWYDAGSGLPKGTGDLDTQVSFWSQLDAVGIDEYAPISDLANPTLNQLIAGWTETPTDAETLKVTGGQSLISYYEGVAEAVGKPLAFTELGYGNLSDAAINPGSPGVSQTGQPDGATADPTLQANLYQAFFDAWAQDGDGSLAAVFLWDWEPAENPGDPYAIQGTSAASVIQGAYTACYAAGTQIATPVGAAVVERLRPGDLVLTAAGESRPVTWVGHRRVRFAARSDRPQPHPIRIRANGFAPGRPCRDLVLSPDHAIFVDGALIPIRHLVNGATIIRESVAEIVYWHVELATHDILLAEGLPAESYLDTGNRAAFANASITSLRASFERDPARAWAEWSCAPLLEDGPIVTAARARLAERAAALGPAAPVILDAPLARTGSTCIAVPAGVEVVRLVSKARRPPEDGRRLGAFVSRITIDDVEIALDDARLVDGFHAIERQGAARLRWTDGAATLAVGRSARPRVMRIEVAMMAPDSIRPFSSVRRSA